MNAEKELLLALLVEKYTIKTQPIPHIGKVLTTKKHHRKSRGKVHRWTPTEKQHVIEKRNAGHSFAVIALNMGLRVSQVENMFYTLTAREMGSN